MERMAKNAIRVIYCFGSSSLLLRRLSTENVTSRRNWIKYGENSLYSRLTDANSNVAKALNEWVREGKAIPTTKVITLVNQLRKHKKYKHAVQLLDWLEKREGDLTPGYHAKRLDLLSRAEGIDLAEKYFTSLPESAKNKLTYGALLNCYCNYKMTEKAMALLEKMRALDFASTCLVYNNLMSLHMSLSEPEKVPQLLQEMKEKNIAPDVYTYNFVMSSFSSLKDIAGVERVMEEMKKDGVKCDWLIYANLASIYVEAGLFDKANSALKDLENMGNLRDRRAYHNLIGLYADTSDEMGVHRAWKSLKSVFPRCTNVCYLFMLQALSKLGDMDGLAKCFEEWESSCSVYDIRLANILIDSYLSRDMIKEAELLCEDAIKKGSKPNFRVLEMFMSFYLKKHQIDLALKYLETAASKANGNGWEPSQETLCMFLKCCEEDKDVDGAEKLCKNLKELKCLDSEVYNSLLCTYIAAGKTDPLMRTRMKEDGIKISSKTEGLLGRVCPE